MLNDYFQLGYFRKTIGLKGELLLYIDADEPEKYQRLESFFVEQDGQAVPFFIEHMQMRDEHTATVKLSEVDGAEESRGLVGQAVYLPLSQLPELEDGHFYLHEVAGYTFVDELNGIKGRINQVLDLPGNPLFELSVGGKTALVPIARDFIVNVDKENQLICLRAPNGLIGLYLDEGEGQSS